MHLDVVDAGGPQRCTRMSPPMENPGCEFLKMTTRIPTFWTRWRASVAYWDVFPLTPRPGRARAMGTPECDVNQGGDILHDVPDVPKGLDDVLERAVVESGGSRRLAPVRCRS